MAVTIPEVLVRGVLGNAHARSLLELLTDRDDPIRYSEARETLSLHPEAFQRALTRLETFALVQIRAPSEEGAASRRPVVLLEASRRGRKLAEAWRRLQEAWSAESADAAPTGARRFKVTGHVRRNGGASTFSSEVAGEDAGEAFERARAAVAARLHVARHEVHVEKVELLPEAPGPAQKARPGRKAAG